MKLRPKYIAIFLAILPSIVTYLTGHMTYMESTWDDFPMRFVLSGEDKFEGPSIFTGTDYMIHHFEYFLNFLYQSIGNLYWYDFLLCMPLISFFYLIHLLALKSSASNLKKFSVQLFFLVFQIYVSTNLHYSLSAIVGGFLFYLVISNSLDSKYGTIIFSIISLIGFCIRFEFFILGLTLATMIHLIFTQFNIKIFFTKKLLLFIPIALLVFSHLKTALYYQPTLGKKTLYLRQLSELSRFDVNNFIDNGESLKNKKNRANFRLIRNYLYHISPDQLNENELEKMVNDSKKYPEALGQRAKRILLERLYTTPKSIILFLIISIFLCFNFRPALWSSLLLTIIYFGFIGSIEVLLKPMVNRHLMGFNIGMLGLITIYCLNSKDVNSNINQRLKTSLSIAIIFLSIFQANKFIALHNIKTFNAKEKLTKLENKIYLVDQNFPFHSLIKPFCPFDIKGPIPVPKNWTLFHGNISEFFRSHNLDGHIIDNLINRKIELVMDNRNIKLIENYIQLTNPDFKFYKITDTPMPMYR